MDASAARGGSTCKPLAWSLAGIPLADGHGPRHVRAQAPRRHLRHRQVRPRLELSRQEHRPVQGAPSLVPSLARALPRRLPRRAAPPRPALPCRRLPGRAHATPRHTRSPRSATHP
eukprot:scaffold52567_cov58-Phaeocystis_antarctica.AAC.3